jgi:hypothetical protein
MKNVLYIMIVMIGVVSFTSCASPEECVCDSGLTITEEDAKDSNATLSEACDLAKIGDSSCAIK